MQCPSCTTPNPANARYCLGCGTLLVSGHVCAACHTLLPPNSRFCFHCGSMVVASITACVSCGSQILPGQAFCGTCGTPAAVPTVSPAQSLPLPRVVQPMMPTQQPQAMNVQPAAPAPQQHMSAASMPVTAPFTQEGVPQAKPLADLLPSLRRYLPDHLYEPLERRPLERDFVNVRDHLSAVLNTAKTYLPKPVVINPQPPGVPTGGMELGTFLFVDVTGFTALSERLAKMGRAGAERVTEIMNELFFDLVSILYHHEGSLLKFGGDAILGVFSVDESTPVEVTAMRATSTAAAMQAIMGKFANMEAAGQTSALHIKVGVSTGPYFAAQIGTKENMGYVTTGRTVNRTEQCEDHAEPGEIVIEQATYDLVKELVEVEPKEEGFYRVLNYKGEVNTEVGKISLVPLDDNPPGDTMMQITYLAERMDRLTPFLAADLLPRLVNDPDEMEINPEHRPVTVMFCNYVGIADLIEDMGETRPEIITQQLHSYFTHMATIVERYEGTLARMDHYAVGDRLVIFFGAPRAHEDDPVRAVYTALEMQAASHKDFMALQTPEGVYRFRQRIGINTGHLFAGNVGAANLRQEYTLMGDDINMAARLMSKAGWDEIFISKRTQERASAFFDLESKGELQVKGKTVPIPTFMVLGRRSEVGQTRGLEAGESPLTGRDAVIAKVVSSIDTVMKGRGQIVSIIGDSGLGKSRTVREVRKALKDREGADKIRIIEGQSLSFSESVSYWLVAQILFGALGLADEANAEEVMSSLWEKGEELLGKETAREAIPFIANILDLPLEGDWAKWVLELDPKARQKQSFWAVREFMCAMAKQQPMLVILDDMHWADEASLALVEDMLSVTDRAPLMFVLVFREMRDKGAWRLRDKADSTYAHRYTQIELKPLTQDESADLLGKLLPGAEIDAEDVEEILDKAAGNPFYLEEVVRALIDSGAVVPDATEPGQWEVTAEIDNIAVPDSLHSAIVSRIDRLTEDARQGLQAASVIGRRFELEVFRGLAGAQSELELLLAQLERTGMIRPMSQPESMYNFHDALVQEVAYDSLLVQRRQEFHRRVGEILETIFAENIGQHAEMLAYHYSRSDNLEKAITYLDLAGEKAQAEFANETALRYYNELIKLLGDDESRWEKRFELLNQRQSVYGLLARQQEREADLKEMVALAEKYNNEVLRSDALCAMSDLLQWTGRYDEAVKIADEALALKEAQQDKIGQSAALHQIGVVNYYRGNYEPAKDALEKAAEFRHEANDAAAESWSELYLTMIHLVSGNYGDAWSHNDAALAAAEQRGDWMLMGIHLNNGGRIAIRMGEYERALEMLAQSLEMRGRVGDRVGQGFTLWSMGLAHTYLAQYDEAEKALRESLQIRQAINDERGVSYCYQTLGLVALGRSDLQRAETYFGQARDLYEKLSLKGELITDLSYLGQVYLAMGRHEDALTISQQAIDKLSEHKNVEEVQQVYLNHYRVLQACGDSSCAEYLQKAQMAMMQQAEAITDVQTRETFLQKVKVNQEIAALV